MQLELTDEDAAVLRAVLVAHLGDLSMQIAHTDNPRFRRDLLHRREVLARIRSALPEAAQAV